MLGMSDLAVHPLPWSRCCTSHSRNAIDLRLESASNEAIHSEGTVNFPNDRAEVELRFERPVRLTGTVCLSNEAIG